MTSGPINLPAGRLELARALEQARVRNQLTRYCDGTDGCTSTVHLACCAKRRPA